MEEKRVERTRELQGWWNTRGRSFLTAALVTALTVIVSGWCTGLRPVMHGAMLSIAAIAFLPFVLIVGGLLLLMTMGFVLGLLALFTGELGLDDHHGLDGAGELVVGGGRWFAARYYGFLRRQRHPLFWGIPVGVLFGGLLLWALIAVVVMPGEGRTVRVLADAKERVGRVYREIGSFPHPADGARLTESALNGGDPSMGPDLVDGFGRPLRYEVSGRGKTSSFILTSYGFDGKPGADDLCLSGATKLMELAEQAAGLAYLLKAIGSHKASTKDEWAGIRALRCPEP